MRLVYGGKFVRKRYHPAATGKLYDLYRAHGVAEEISQNLEIKFMTPLDTGAAAVLDRLITGKPLDLEQHMTWARYLLSMLYRNPDSVEVIKTHMADIWREGIDALEANYTATRKPHQPATAAELVAKHKPGAAGVSAANMIVDIIGNSSAVTDIVAMPWTVVDVSKSKFSLLTSDRPLVMSHGLSDPLCYLALPLSPHRLFVASHDRRYANKLPGARHTRIVKAMNMDVVRQAREFVWGRDDAQAEFVQKHMRTVPDRVILTDDQRQQAIAAARGL